MRTIQGQQLPGRALLPRITTPQKEKIEYLVETSFGYKIRTQPANRSTVHSLLLFLETRPELIKFVNDAVQLAIHREAWYCAIFEDDKYIQRFDEHDANLILEDAKSIVLIHSSSFPHKMPSRGMITLYYTSAFLK